jgi:hypothetical protein
MTTNSDDEGKVTLGCIAIGIVVLIILAFVRYFVLTPTGWGF